jgi:hypothetical protein
MDSCTFTPYSISTVVSTMRRNDKKNKRGAVLESGTSFIFASVRQTTRAGCNPVKTRFHRSAGGSPTSN